MISLDLNSVLNSQYKENRGYKKLLSWYFVLRNFLPINWSFKKANRKLQARLAILKEMHAYLMEKAPELKDTDLRAEITSTEKLIEYIYGQRDILEGHMPHAGFKPLQPSLDITSEIITVLHSILRILQKNTLKPPLTNKTEEATLAVNRSKKTINKLYDR